MPQDSTPTSSSRLGRLVATIGDPRLIIGVVLVASSVAGVIAIVTTADETSDVYVAADSLAPGDVVEAGDLTIQGMRLERAAERYLAPGDIPDGGVVVSHPIGAGELVPRSAVGDSDGVRLTAIVVSTEAALAESVGSGSAVDVWATRAGEGGEFAEPAVVVPGAIVVRLVESTTIVAGGEVTAVEVLVPKSRVARLLEALANDDSISIVPTSLPLGE